MTDAIHLAGALTAGVLLGALFFGGLLWTTHKGIGADNPALWFFGSWLVRAGSVGIGLYFVTGGDWRRAVACLIGLIAARTAVLRLAGSNARRRSLASGPREPR